MKFEHIDHTLAIGDIYFHLEPTHFLFEPIEDFNYNGKNYVFAPDCIFTHDKKVYVCEVQLSNLSASGWAKKWSIYNKYFESAFKNGRFQEWGSGKTILPRFIAITTNKKAAEGFSIPQRELLIVDSISSLI